MKKILAIIILLVSLCGCQHMDLDERTMIVQYKRESGHYNLSKYIVNIKDADVYRTIQFTAPSDAFHVGDTLTFTKVSK